MKTYIIPSGWDKDLVLKTVFKSGADKVCLISAHIKEQHTYSKTDNITKKVTAKIFKELSRFTQVDILEVNYIDLKDIILNLSRYIKNNPGNEFVINISTGSHLLAAALILVAHMNNIAVEYSIAKNHNPKIMNLVEDGEDYHKGLSEIIKIPTLPFSLKFTAGEKKVIELLQNNNSVTVSDFVAGANGNNENRMRSEFHYISKKLEKQGLIEIKPKGKKVFLSFTKLGELIL